MSVEEYYRALFEQRRAIVEAGIGDSATFAMHTKSHNFIKELETISALITGPEKAVFLIACREYQFALEAILSGRYRHAYASLRLTIEFLLSSVFFSAHQLKLNLWLKGAEDLVWSAINDENKGVFSHNFLRAFFPELGEYRAQYLTLVNTVYRECSEYVHGNPSTHDNDAGPIEYDAERVKDFHDKVETVRLCSLFAFVTRYLPTTSQADRAGVEPIVLEAFGNLPEIQAQFEADS